MNELEGWLGRQDWWRDSDGPCISLGAAGAFDDTHVFCPAVIFDRGLCRMYYCGSRGVPADDADRVYRVGPAESNDESRHWESNYTTSHTVLPLADGRLRIWYAARCGDIQAHKYFAIGTAVWDPPDA